MDDTNFVNELADEFEGLLETYVDDLEPEEVIDGLSLLIGRLDKAFPGADLIDRAVSNLEELDNLN